MHPQAFGWLFLLILTLIAFTIRATRPCFSQAAFLKTKYWSHYFDIERKMFDELCAEHAKSFAKVCIHQYFQSASEDMHKSQSQTGDDDKEDDEEQSHEEDKLLGIQTQEDMNNVLWNWHISKPPLSLRKPGASDNGNQKENMKTGYDNATFTADQKENGYVTPKNGNSYMNQRSWDTFDHSSRTKKKEWAVYYSKV